MASPLRVCRASTIISGDLRLMREHFESRILNVFDVCAYASDGKRALRRCSGQACGTTPHANRNVGNPGHHVPEREHRQECLCHGLIDDQRAARPIGGPSEEFEAATRYAASELAVGADGVCRSCPRLITSRSTDPNADAMLSATATRALRARRFNRIRPANRWGKSSRSFAVV